MSFADDSFNQIPPPDDTGATTFERFLYQAEVCFRYCLQCALADEIVAVVAEHIEDVALQTTSGWRFQQIKTRDPELGPWRLSSLISSGALQSILRTYNHVRDKCASFTLEVVLEGPVFRRDPINELIECAASCSPGTRKRIADALTIDSSDCDALLANLRVYAKYPDRDVIQEANIVLLMRATNCADGELLTRSHDQMMALVIRAMSGGVVRPDWALRALTSTSARTQEERYKAKRLERDDLLPLMPPQSLSAPAQRKLLQRVHDESRALPSSLEMKLIVGGAEDALVKEALDHRARAAAFKSRKGVGSLLDRIVNRTPAALERLDNMLVRQCSSIAAANAKEARPANAMWPMLKSFIFDNASSLDVGNVFQRDAELLLGEVCELSDQCKTDWGRAR